MHDKHVPKSKACYWDETGEHNCKHVGGQAPGGSSSFSLERYKVAI